MRVPGTYRLAASRVVSHSPGYSKSRPGSHGYRPAASAGLLDPSEHPFKDGTFYSNFGGSAIRYDKVPGALGMLESLDNPLPIGIAMRIEWAEPRAWRCSGSRSTWQIFPGGGCAKTDGSCWSKGERGRGAGDALAKKGRARYCLTPMEACSPWGGQGSRGPARRPQPARNSAIVHGSHLPPIQSHLLQRKLKRREEILADPEAYHKQQTIQGVRPGMLQGWS